MSLTCVGSRNSANSLNFEITPKLRTEHFLALIIIALVVGFRYYVGDDWEGYKYYFQMFKNSPYISFGNQQMELGFFYINKIISKIGLTYQWMFFTMAFISWYFYFKSVPKQILSLFIFFLFADEYFFWSMNGVRQFVAMGIFLFSIKFIIERNFKVYLLLIIFASLFHYSILFVAPVYFIPFQKLYNQKFWIISFFVSLFFANTPFLVNGLQNIYIHITNDFPLLSMYEKYFSNGKYEARNIALGFGYVFRQLILIIILIFSKSIIKKYPQTKVYFILYFSGAIIFNVFYMFQPVGRLNNYFLIFRPVDLAIVVFYLWKTKKYQFVSISLVLLYFLLFLAEIYQASNMCSPYQFSF